MRRRFSLPTTVPPWVTLLAGTLLGCVLTSTFTFHWRWCADKVALGDVSLDRQTVSIISVNEHIRAHGNGVAIGGGGWERNLGQQDQPDWENCVCGNELKKLKAANGSATKDLYNGPGIEPTYKPSIFIPKPSLATFSPVWNYSNSKGALNYTHPVPARDHVSREQLLSEEFHLQRNFIVAVNVPDDGLSWATEIYNSWGQDVPQILFFVSENCNNISDSESIVLPLIKLSGIDGSLENSVEKAFSILGYLHENYRYAFKWFILVNVQTFVWVQHMEDVLSRLDSSSRVYLGWATKGRPEDAEFLRLLDHERYCLGGPGMVFSQATLRALGRELAFCLQSVQRYNQQEDGLWVNWDVEIGRCVSRTVGIQCSQSAEAKAYFYQDFSPKSAIAKSALSLPPFTHLLTYFPVPTHRGHAALHLHYKKKEFSDSLDSSRYLQEKINSLCTELREDDTCSVYVCPCRDSATSVSCPSKCPAADTVTTLTKSYTPISKYDIPTWQYFDSYSVYNDETTIPCYALAVRKDWKSEIQTVMKQVLLEVRAHTGRRMLKLRKILNGYARHNPSRGIEYIIDAEYYDGRSLFRARTSLIQPLAKNYIVLKDNNDKSTLINFIVPISNVNERFKVFMTMYEECCLKQDANLRLVLVIYGEEDVAFVKEIIQPFIDKYKKAKITIIEGSGVFSRGRALHLGMAGLTPEELAFHCDVDMTVLTSFLQRCRKNTIRGRRVYYPEFFKLYNLDYVYIGRPRPKKIPLKRQHGHWASYSFGMLCIYKSDYDEVGGMDTSIVGWGEEDVKFYDMVLKKQHLEVFRVPDTGLTHRWHEKMCPDSLSLEQRKHCYSSRAENLADRIQLANYIYSNDFQIKYATGPPPLNSSLRTII